MPEIGKWLVAAGVGLIVIGIVVWTGFGKGWLGQLPGDIQYSKGGVRFYFPVVTCLLISIVLTILLRLFRK